MTKALLRAGLIAFAGAGLAACSVNTAPPVVATTPAPSPVMVEPAAPAAPSTVVVQPRAY